MSASKPLLLAMCVQMLPAAAFSPVLSKVDPPGGQRGTEVDVSFHGERLEGINSVLFYEPGLSLKDLQIKEGKLASGKLVIAPDATLGEHSLRLTGPGGVSELRSFWIGQFPTANETEPNPPDKAQRIELNQTVHGVAGNEDDDAYVVTLKKGQRLSAEVEAMRLGRTLFDASLAILDAKGFELATCDDAPLLRTDAFVSILAPEDGDYRVVVREAAYEGSDQCQYRLHIGTFPRPKAVFPTEANPVKPSSSPSSETPRGRSSKASRCPPKRSRTSRCSLCTMAGPLHPRIGSRFLPWNARATTMPLTPRRERCRCRRRHVPHRERSTKGNPRIGSSFPRKRTVRS